MNHHSSRSHTIFRINVTSIRVLAEAEEGSVTTESILNFVDLAGSERVSTLIDPDSKHRSASKTESLLTEGKHINTSLFYLCQVINKLSEKSTSKAEIHVPYRNSLLTLVLRDSIGGNCKTRMIANISSEAVDIDESIATCRFASRVALIKNTVTRNEAVDPALVIERLKRENAELKAELAMLKGGDVKDQLNEIEVEECKKQVEDFIKNREPGSHLILSDRLKINECFYHFKHLYNDLLKRSEGSTGYKETGKLSKGTLEMNNNDPNKYNYMNNNDTFN